MSEPKQEVHKTYRGNMMCLKFGYDFSVILPVDKATEVLRMLSDAELYVDKYGENAQILPMNKDISIHLLAVTEYELLKIKQLLGSSDGAE